MRQSVLGISGQTMAPHQSRSVYSLHAFQVRDGSDTSGQSGGCESSLLPQSQLPPWLPLVFIGISSPLGPTRLSQKETRHVCLEQALMESKLVWGLLCSQGYP